jgi:hypothetical protein
MTLAQQKGSARRAQQTDPTPLVVLRTIFMATPIPPLRHRTALEPPPPSAPHVHANILFKMAERSRSPTPRVGGPRAHVSRHNIDVISGEEPPKVEEVSDSSVESPSRPCPWVPGAASASASAVPVESLSSAAAPTSATALPVDSEVDAAYLLREVRALWDRVRNLEEDVNRLSRLSVFTLRSLD